MNKAIVTTSWDDGHKLDLRLAALLAKYGVPATFYIAPKNREFAPKDLLTDRQVKELSKTFEIGSHTMTHPIMTQLSTDELAYEVNESKHYLTTLTGQNITTFCYPRGIYGRQTVQAVKDAGYSYARTVERFSVSPTSGVFESPTSLEAHRGPLPHFLSDFIKIARLNRFRPIATFRCLNWEYLAKILFDRAVATGGVFHLWGHSWVVEQSNDWERLERVMAYIAERRNEVDFCTNGQMAERLKK